MLPQTFFHVALKVDDPDSAAAFYQAHLDADILERRRAEESNSELAVDAVVLDVADKLVYLFDQAPYEAAGLVDDLPVGFLHFGYVVDDIADAFAHLTAADVEILMEPTQSGDKRIGFFLAPGGVRIEFIEYIE